MVYTAHAGTILMLTTIFLGGVSSSDYNVNPNYRTYNVKELSDLAPDMAKEYGRQIHSMMNAYKADVLNERLVIETNALIDTKYKTWKRNADLINSILALPKGMNDAGR